MTHTSPKATVRYASSRQSASSCARAYSVSTDTCLRDLKRESYGAELLQAIGFVYVSKSKQYLATNQSFLGVGGWLHNVQGKYHVFSETCVLPLHCPLSVKGGLAGCRRSGRRWI